MPGVDPFVFLGVQEFRQCGPARPYPDGWDLDRLVVPFDGPIAYLDPFVNTRVMWSPSAINGNMFLADFAGDGGKRYPMVELTYIGKLDGQPTPIKHSKAMALQSANVTDPVAGEWSIEIIAKCRIATNTQIGRVEETITPPDASANDTVLVWKKFHKGSSYQGSSPVTDAEFLMFFTQTAITTNDSEELVPDQYYRNTATTQITIRPLF